MSRPAQPGPWCGTDGGYVNHSCGCPACTEAHTRACRKRRHDRYAERRKNSEGDLFHPRVQRHGTVSAYQYWGCRCRSCRWTMKATVTRRTKGRR